MSYVASIPVRSLYCVICLFFAYANMVIFTTSWSIDSMGANYFREVYPPMWGLYTLTYGANFLALPGLMLALFFLLAAFSCLVCSRAFYDQIRRERCRFNCWWFLLTDLVLVYFMGLIYRSGKSGMNYHLEFQYPHSDIVVAPWEFWLNFPLLKLVAEGGGSVYILFYSVIVGLVLALAVQGVVLLLSRPPRNGDGAASA